MIFKAQFFYSRVTLLLLAGVSTLAGQPLSDEEAESIPLRMQVLDDETQFQVGDRLRYQVLEERENPVELFVDGQGEVRFPLVGRVLAINRTPFELAVELKFMLEQDYFHQATVIIEPLVDTGQRGRVNIIGEVRTNGMQPLPSDAAIRLSEMILRSGGFTEEADQSNVRLIRQGGSGPEGERLEAGTYTYDVKAMMDSGNFDEDPYLVANDVILVPKLEDIGGEYLVLGAVNREGAFPIDQKGITISRAILAAGGFSRFAQDRKVRLIRTDEETGESRERTINVQAILEGEKNEEDIEIQDGDIIRVDEKLINL